MQVLVISGFLGAGKTTFLKELARRTHRDFAVMENEYGDLGVDGAVLQEDSRNLNIWELTEGCICCSSKADFASSVLTIANTLDPEYLIVEPTGVGMLSKVLENLRKIQYDKIQLLSPITMVDGKSFHRYRAEHGEIFLDQIKNAGTILVTKMESAEEEDRLSLKKELQILAPRAEILETPYKNQEDAFFSSLLLKGHQGEVTSVSQQEAELETLSLSDVSLSSPDHLLLFLNGIVSGVFGPILRSKGYLKAGNSWLRFDTADLTYSITGCGPQEDSRAVFIGRNLNRSLLRQALQQEITVTAWKAPASRRRAR